MEVKVKALVLVEQECVGDEKRDQRVVVTKKWSTRPAAWPASPCGI